MNREERIKHMFYGWDEEKEILREIQQCQRNWDHSHEMHQEVVDYLLWTADNSPSKQHEGYFDLYWTKDRKVLDVNFIKFEKKFQNKSVPKPPHWGGYKVIPNLIEFWQGREDRMHDRFTYTKKLNRKLEVNWVINRLSP